MNVTTKIVSPPGATWPARLPDSATSSATGPLGLLKRAVMALLAYRALRRAEARLMALDPWMLKDIGIDRSEIRSSLMAMDRERFARR